jgi:hypothetical protein
MHIAKAAIKNIQLLQITPTAGSMNIIHEAYIGLREQAYIPFVISLPLGKLETNCTMDVIKAAIPMVSHTQPNILVNPLLTEKISVNVTDSISRTMAVTKKGAVASMMRGPTPRASRPDAEMKKLFMAFELLVAQRFRIIKDYANFFLANR